MICLTTECTVQPDIQHCAFIKVWSRQTVERIDINLGRDHDHQITKLSVVTASRNTDNPIQSMIWLHDSSMTLNHMTSSTTSSKAPGLSPERHTSDLRVNFTSNDTSTDQSSHRVNRLTRSRWYPWDSGVCLSTSKRDWFTHYHLTSTTNSPWLYHFCRCASRASLPSNRQAMMIVWRTRGNIINLCRNNCTQLYAHSCEQFLQMNLQMLVYVWLLFVCIVVFFCVS